MSLPSGERKVSLVRVMRAARARASRRVSKSLRSLVRLRSVKSFPVLVERDSRAERIWRRCFFSCWVGWWAALAEPVAEGLQMSQRPQAGACVGGVAEVTDEGGHAAGGGLGEGDHAVDLGAADGDLGFVGGLPAGGGRSCGVGGIVQSHS